MKKNQNNGLFGCFFFSPSEIHIWLVCLGFFPFCILQSQKYFELIAFTSVSLLLQLCVPGFTGAWGWACVWEWSSLCWALCGCGCTRAQTRQFQTGRGVFAVCLKFGAVCSKLSFETPFLSKTMCSALITELLVLLPDILSCQGDPTGFLENFPWHVYCLSLTNSSIATVQYSLRFHFQ